MKDFSIFLNNHIKEEEKYEKIFLNNFKKFIYKIHHMLIKIKDENSDSFLIDNLLNLWNKINLSYQKRYDILKFIINLKEPYKIYNLLENENMHLLKYYKLSENLFKEIKIREMKKINLQKLIDKKMNFIKEQKQLDVLTKKLSEKIFNFKYENKGYEIIWRGIKYENLLKYENWLYNNERKK